MNVRHDMVTLFVARPAGTSHELLQLRRISGDYMGGTWQTVRGMIETGETAAQAALRELGEETSLWPFELYALSSIESLYIQHADTMWHCPVFGVIVSSGKVVLDAEHDEHRWVALESIDRSFMWPTERSLIREFRDEILGDGLTKPHLRIDLPLDPPRPLC